MDTRKFLNKIRQDRRFYMEQFLKIRTKSGELIKFKLKPCQRKVQEIIDKKRKEGKPVRVICLKARQMGMSTQFEANIFHDTANNPFKNSMIIAHEDKATQNLFAMSKLYYEELPNAIRPMKKYSNETALTFENPTNDDIAKHDNPGLRSKITVATARNVDAGRSATIHNLHASEVAFWDNAQTLMTGLLQCVPDLPGTSVYIESTANGVGGWFYDFWKRSERGETDYIPIFLAWFEEPDYTKDFETEQEKKEFIASASDEEKEMRERFNLTWEQLNWRRKCIANNLNGDEELFRQEYPSTSDEAFIVSGRPQFSIEALRKYEQNKKKPIWQGYLEAKASSVSLIADAKGYVRIWRMPEEGKFYVIGADVSEGLITGDYSAAVVYDEDYNLCASWHGHIDPDLFGIELVKLGKFYNDAYLGIERNNHGHATIRSVLRQEYWNIYYQKTYEKVTDSVTQKVGWLTNSKTKPLMIDKLTEFIREKWIGMPWDTLVSECMTYVKQDDGKTGAQSGSHDDTVMATAIALQLLLEGKGETYDVEAPEDERKSIFSDLEYSNEEVGVDNSSEVEYAI